jgi:hypothetical protein
VRFASLESVRRAALDALRRFPLPLACAWIAGALAGVLVHLEGNHPTLVAACLAASLGISLGLSLTLLAERLEARAGSPRPALRPALLAAGVAALALVAWRWPHWTGPIQVRRFLQIALFTHALVAFLPYLRVREPNGFWQYNRTLLERLVVASVFSGVLLVGLQGALASLKPLFGIQIPARAFADLAIVVGFGFHPWVFLAGIPGDLGALDRRRDYPATIRVFARFILVPLVAVYQVLLTAYLVRVVVTGQWPSGLIGWLVSAEAGAGLLAILLVHPVREQAENRWVRTFARGFFVALIPSIVMLALSIGKRVGQYGVTEDRYFVIVLTGWLAGISLYFIARRDGDIRWIPVTLALLALLTLGGPWSAYGVSLASQRGRLAHLLESHGLLVNGRVAPAPGPTPVGVQKELSGVLTYLLEVHGSAAVRPLLSGPLAAADSGFVRPDQTPANQRARRLVERIGLQYVEAWQSDPSQEFRFTGSYHEPVEAVRVAGLDYHVRLAYRLPQAFVSEGRRFELRLVAAERRIVLVESPDTLGGFAIDELLAAARAGRANPSNSGSVRVGMTGAGARGFLEATQFSGVEKPELRLDGLSGDLYFTPLAPPPATAGAAPAR